MKIYVATVI